MSMGGSRQARAPATRQAQPAPLPPRRTFCSRASIASVPQHRTHQHPLFQPKQRQTAAAAEARDQDVDAAGIGVPRGDGEQRRQRLQTQLAGRAVGYARWPKGRKPLHAAARLLRGWRGKPVWQHGLAVGDETIDDGPQQLLQGCRWKGAVGGVQADTVALNASLHLPRRQLVACEHAIHGPGGELIAAEQPAEPRRLVDESRLARLEDDSGKLIALLP